MSLGAGPEIVVKSPRGARLKKRPATCYAARHLHLPCFAICRKRRDKQVPSTVRGRGRCAFVGTDTWPVALTNRQLEAIKDPEPAPSPPDRKSTRLNSSHSQ